MGIYQRTLRSETKTVADLEIARYGFAYKTGWEWFAGQRRGRPGRVIGALEAHAENAAYKNRKVRHFVVGEWRYAAECEGGLPIYQIAEDQQLVEQFTESPYQGEIVGHLVKISGRFQVNLK